jgi:hypothetical protein
LQGAQTTRGVVVTTGRFSPGALQFRRERRHAFTAHRR